MSKELFSTTTFLCPRLQNTQETSPCQFGTGREGKGITHVAVEAIIQSFKDGSSRILCTKKNKEIECEITGKKCDFEVGCMKE